MADKNKSMQVQQQQLVESEGSERTRSRDTYLPRADIYETQDSIHIALDMPGANQNQIDVTLEQNVLTISGMTAHAAPEGYSPTYLEFRPGDYERSFRLTEQIDRDKIDAVYKDGVLKLTLPKAETAKVRKISVNPA